MTYFNPHNTPDMIKLSQKILKNNLKLIGECYKEPRSLKELAEARAKSEMKLNKLKAQT